MIDVTKFIPLDELETLFQVQSAFLATSNAAIRLADMADPAVQLNAFRGLLGQLLTVTDAIGGKLVAWHEALEEEKQAAAINNNIMLSYRCPRCKAMPRPTSETPQESSDPLALAVVCDSCQWTGTLADCERKHDDEFAECG